MGLETKLFGGQVAKQNKNFLAYSFKREGSGEGRQKK